MERSTVRAETMLGRAALLVAALLLALGLLGSKAAQAAVGEVRLLTVDGVIGPLTAQYVTREIQEASQARAAAVVVRLDTPGGLDQSMRAITQAMLNAPVPVVVYVAPPGARAASAGMFVTIAAHVAAMAPGTNIGAAHPVGIGGETGEVMESKAVNDAAALARAIAVARDRNASWAERAVRESVSITAEEALEQNVVDLIAEDLPTLLERIDGRTVPTTAGPVVLRTAGAPVVERPLSLLERIVQTITDPNIAYLLFTVGMIGIVAELYNPGSLVPGIAGAIALILAFVAFGNLPINWAGVLLLLLAVGLFVGELYTAGVGVLGVGGVVAFVLGSLLLFTPFTPPSPATPRLRVDPWLVALLSGVVAGLVLFVLRAVRQTRQVPVSIGPEALVGRVGLATTDLAPVGVVRVDSETWSAEALDPPVAAGESVEVVAVQGVTLYVKQAPPRHGPGAGRE
ncbi:MAG TPA: nodulation protein NfeD [Chloroflexota bacterium]